MRGKIIFLNPGNDIMNQEMLAVFGLIHQMALFGHPAIHAFMQEELHMPIPDAILFDYSEDAAFHSGLEGAAKIANAYPNTPLILGHWGFVDAPDFIPFNGNPERLKKLVVNPSRIIVLAPGEPFTLK